MRSLREFAKFVGKPNDPISPRALTEYLSLNIPSRSVRELIETFEGSQLPVSFDPVITPPSGIVPFQAALRTTNHRGYIFAIHWRVLLNGQQVAEYTRLKDKAGAFSGFEDTGHTFSEAGTYTVEVTVKGIGNNGYAEVTKSVTVVAQPKPTPTPPPPPPPQSTWRLSLRLAPVVIIPSTLQIVSAEWKVTPLWNPSQVFNVTGSTGENRYTGEVTLPVPSSSSSERRVQVELKFRCAVAGIIEGVVFPPQEFDGLLNSSPIFIGWEGRSLKAGWFCQWEVAQNRINVMALFQGTEAL